MELIDTHCHLSFNGLAENIDAVVQRGIEAGVKSWITVGTDPAENQKAVRLAESFENMYAAVGIHPHDAKIVTAGTIHQLEQLAENQKVVAIGETGLDFHYDLSPHEQQIRVFAQHLTIAKKLNLPVIVHCREAFDVTVDVLDRFADNVRGIVFHCFSGTSQQAEILLQKGYYISFTGVVTFKNAQAARDAAAVVPLDRLMIETDCPYMSPEPVRKQSINEPALMVHTAKLLAELKKMNFEDFAQAVTATSKNFFALPGCSKLPPNATEES
jgi:TatD DNase family protein